MKRKAKQVGIAVVVAVVLVVLFPVEQTVAPDWQVTVVDEKGNRLAGIHVRETWRQASIEPKDNEEVRQTDASGKVVFPRRVQRSSVLRRTFGCWEEIRNGSKAGCGPRASIWAFGPGLGTMDEDDVRETHARYRPREIAPELKILPDAVVEEQSSMVLLHRCAPGYFGPGCKIAESK